MGVKWIIWFAVFLHLLWGILLMISGDPVNITAIHTSMSLFKFRLLLGSVYIIAGFSSAISLRSKRRKSLTDLLLLLPQQFLLMVSAGGAINAMYLSQFADGVIRPRSFLVADQMPVVFIALFHSCAILDSYIRKSGA